MLKEKRYAFPPVKMELAGDFFAILIGFTMEAALDDSYGAQGAHMSAQHDPQSCDDPPGPDGPAIVDVQGLHALFHCCRAEVG